MFPSRVYRGLVAANVEHAAKINGELIQGLMGGWWLGTRVLRVAVHGGQRGIHTQRTTMSIEIGTWSSGNGGLHSWEFGNRKGAWMGCIPEGRTCPVVTRGRGLSVPVMHRGRCGRSWHWNILCVLTFVRRVRDKGLKGSGLGRRWLAWGHEFNGLAASFGCLVICNILIRGRWWLTLLGGRWRRCTLLGEVGKRGFAVFTTRWRVCILL